MLNNRWADNTHMNRHSNTHGLFFVSLQTKKSYFSFTTIRLEVNGLTELKKHGKSNAEMYQSAWTLRTLNA